MTCQLILHPLVISTFQQFLFIFVAGFTAPSSIFRPLGFAVLLCSTWIALTSFNDYVEPPGWVARTVASAFAQIPLTYFERMIVRKIAFGEEDGTNTSEDAASKLKTKSQTNPLTPMLAAFRRRYAFGQLVASSMRGLGTPWEVKHIHLFDSQDPSYVPSPTSFVIRNILTTVACYFAHTLCISTQLSLDQSFMMPGNVPFFRRLGEISLAELKVRYIATVTTVLSIYCFIQGGYSLASAASVLMNPSAVKEWRPVFGELSGSYCLRRFWSVFWHQGLQNNLRGSAAWITRNVFRLRSYSRFSQYLKILIAFFLSGLVHVPSDMGSAVPASASGAIQFFSTQIIGLMIEDVCSPLFQPLWRTRTGRALARPLGYFWVITFLAWSGPVRWFPVIRMQNHETELIRLSAFRPLAKVWTC